MKPRQWLALVVSYLGVLVVFGHDVSLQGEHVVLGSLLVLGSAVSYALYLVFSGQAVKRLGPMRITGVATRHRLRAVYRAVLRAAIAGRNGRGA